jgi:hypothetical protein
MSEINEVSGPEHFPGASAIGGNSVESDGIDARQSGPAPDTTLVTKPLEGWFNTARYPTPLDADAQKAIDDLITKGYEAWSGASPSDANDKVRYASYPVGRLNIASPNDTSAIGQHIRQTQLVPPNGLVTATEVTEIKKWADVKRLFSGWPLWLLVALLCALLAIIASHLLGPPHYSSAIGTAGADYGRSRHLPAGSVAATLAVEQVIPPAPFSGASQSSAGTSTSSPAAPVPTVDTPPFPVRRERRHRVHRSGKRGIVAASPAPAAQVPEKKEAVPISESPASVEASQIAQAPEVPPLALPDSEQGTPTHQSASGTKKKEGRFRRAIRTLGRALSGKPD